ncbi:MAG: MoaD/ThiS family protein [Acetobacterales bacterium]
MTSAGSVPPRVVVWLPPVLVRLFPGSRQRVDVTATTVEEAIDALDALWPGMRDRLCDSTPAIRRHLNVFVEAERATLATPLAPGSEVTVLTAMSGGRGTADASAKSRLRAVDSGAIFRCALHMSCE